MSRQYTRRGASGWTLWACVNNDDWVEVSGSQLLDYNAFRGAVLEQRGIYLPPCADAEWEALVERRVRELGLECVVQAP